MNITNRLGTKTIWLTLVIMSLATFITTFDTTFMNVAIINLVQELNTTVGAIQAIITLYSLTMGCLMLLGAKLQDIIGRKKTFLIGSAIYGVGTLIATFSFNEYMLLLGWSILEGIGAALMMPATLSLITGTYKGDQRTFAIGLVGGVSSVAAAVGPLLGGFLTTFLSWRYGFGMEFIMVIFMIIASTRILEFPTTITWKDLDIWGAVLSAAGLVLVVLGILQLNNINNWYLAPYLIVGGGIFLLTFYLWQKRRINEDKTPLLDLKLFKKTDFFAGNVVRILGNIGLGGIIFIIPVFMGVVVGGDAFTIGISLLPLTMSLLVFALLAPRLSHIIRPAYLITSGLIMAFGGCLILINSFTLETTIMDLVPGTALLGAGCGLSFVLCMDIMLVSAQEKQSDASGAVNTMAMLGYAIGTAFIGIILLVGTFTGLATAVEQQLPGQYSPQEIQQNLHTWIQKYETTDLRAFKNDNSKVARIADGTIAGAMNTAFIALAVIFFLGIISSLFLWRKPKSQILIKKS